MMKMQKKRFNLVSTVSAFYNFALLHFLAETIHQIYLDLWLFQASQESIWRKTYLLSNKSYFYNTASQINPRCNTVMVKVNQA